MPNAKGLGYSQNRRVSGQRLCLLFSQISIFADRDVPAFSKAGTFFLLRYLKNGRKCPLCSRGLFENIAHLFPDKRQKHVRVLFGDFNIHHKIPLDFFRELHILTVKKLMFPFCRGNPPPVLVGGCLIFYIAAQRGQPRYAAQLYLH